MIYKVLMLACYLKNSLIRNILLIFLTFFIILQFEQVRFYKRVKSSVVVKYTRITKDKIWVQGFCRSKVKTFVFQRSKESKLLLLLWAHFHTWWVKSLCIFSSPHRKEFWLNPYNGLVVIHEHQYYSALYHIKCLTKIEL